MSERDLRPMTRRREALKAKSGFITDNTPYVSRQTGGGLAGVGCRSLPTIIGATVAWNQLITNGNFADGTNGWTIRGGVSMSASDGILSVSLSRGGGTATRGIYNQIPVLLPNHVVLVRFAIRVPIQDVALRIGLNTTNNVTTDSNPQKTFEIGTFSSVFQTVNMVLKTNGNEQYFVIGTRSSTTNKNPDFEVKNVTITDLTALFGSSAIGDYIHSLEQTVEGSGAAKLREWGFFTKDYYAYDAGSLQSVCISAHKTYDANNVLLGNYPLDGTKEFRGLFKLDANNKLYADGDIYKADGTVTRKYGIVDLGTLDYTTYEIRGTQVYISTTIISNNIVTPATIYQKAHGICCGYILDTPDNTANLATGYISIGPSQYGYGKKVIFNIGEAESEIALKNKLSGVYLVYELATPTAESADPYAAAQVVEAGGTEEFIDAGTRDVAIPVGHETKYTIY